MFRPTDDHIFLKNQNATGFADIDITFGIPGDKPIVGDWNNDGVNTIGVYRNGTLFLRNSNTTGYADLQATFGLSTDLPVIGDWNGDGTDTIGLYRNGLFILSNSNTIPNADFQFALGISGDVPIAGDWNGDGTDTVGVFRPSDGHIFLKNANTTGFADVDIVFGIPNDKPLTGDWDAMAPIPSACFAVVRCCCGIQTRLDSPTSLLTSAWMGTSPSLGDGYLELSVRPPPGHRSRLRLFQPAPEPTYLRCHPQANRDCSASPLCFPP